MPPLFHGNWYISKVALDKIAALPIIIGSPVYQTPEGFALLVFDVGGQGSIVDGVTPAPTPPVLVPQNESGHDLMTLVGDRAGRVTFSPSDLPDLARLVHYDHLPEARKDPSGEMAGSRLA